MKKLLVLVLAAVMTLALSVPAFAAYEGEGGVYTFPTTYSENEYAGQIIKFLDEKLQELSDGKISLDIYWGGTVMASGEEIEAIGSGMFDMTLIGQSNYTAELSLLNFPSQVSTGYADSVKLMDTIAFENEKTAPYVQAEIEENNLKMLGSLPGGSNSFITKTEYTSLDEMKGITLGIGMNQSAMEALGFTVVSMMPWDYYDQLSRGVAEAGYMSTTALVSMGLQEVTPFFLADGTYTAGNFITINLDRWNEMSEEDQAVFVEASKAAQEYAIEIAGTMDEEVSEEIEAAGGKLQSLGEEDGAKVLEAFFETGVADAKGYAIAADTVEAMDIIIAEVAAMNGFEVPDVEATVAQTGDSDGESADGESADLEG